MLAPQPFFEPRGTPFSVLGRVKALSDLGHEVDLVTYHLGKDVHIPRLRIHRIPRVGFIRSISIGPSVKKIFLDLLLWHKAKQMLRLHSYDIVHSHEEASFFGVFLARRFGLPHLYDMHSSLPEQLSNFRYSHFAPLLSLFEWIERKVIDSSQGLITICPALEDRVRKLNKDIPQVMIENVASDAGPDGPPPEGVVNFRLAYQLDGKKVILYAGSFEPYQGIHLLLQSAERVLQEHRDVLFLLIGGKTKQIQACRDEVRRRGLDRYFCFTGTLPAEEIPQAIKLAQVLVSPRISGTNTPLKIYSYLRSGKPIVATNLYTHIQVLTPEVSVLVRPDGEAMALGILSVLNDSALAQRLATNARRLFERDYTTQKFLQKTDSIIRMAIR